jgi:hypothetical protein
MKHLVIIEQLNKMHQVLVVLEETIEMFEGKDSEENEKGYLIDQTCLFKFLNSNGFDAVVDLNTRITTARINIENLFGIGAPETPENRNPTRSLDPIEPAIKHIAILRELGYLEISLFALEENIYSLADDDEEIEDDDININVKPQIMEMTLERFLNKTPKTIINYIGRLSDVNKLLNKIVETPTKPEESKFVKKASSDSENGTNSIQSEWRNKEEINKLTIKINH